MKINRECLRKVSDVFSTVYQDLGELAPTYENDHLVVTAYELARVAGEVSLLLRSAIGDSGFRVVSDVTSELSRPEIEIAELLNSYLVPKLRSSIDDAASLADDATKDLLDRVNAIFRYGLGHMNHGTFGSNSDSSVADEELRASYMAHPQDPDLVASAMELARLNLPEF